MTGTLQKGRQACNGITAYKHLEQTMQTRTKQTSSVQTALWIELNKTWDNAPELLTLYENFVTSEIFWLSR